MQTTLPITTEATADLPLQPKTRADWLAITKDWALSSESQPEYCEKRSINYKSFAYWRGKFLKEQRQQTSTGFLPVNLKSSQQAPASKHSLILKLPTGITLSLDNDVSPQVLSFVFSNLGIK